MAILVVHCHEWDLAFSLDPVVDLAVDLLLVGLHCQQHVGLPPEMLAIRLYRTSSSS